MALFKRQSAADLGFRVTVVLPAGGSGLRADTPTPKQYWLMSGRPLLYYTLEVLDSVPFISEVIVPVSEDRLAWVTEQAEKWKLTKTRFIIGGDTRHRSIHEGIKAISEATAKANDVVIVHDAVRPFVDEKSLEAVSKAAREHGAAGMVLPLVSTVVKPTADGFMEESLDRNQYRASQTPQAFHYSVIKEAYSKCTEYDYVYGTECLHLALTYGKTRPKLVDGGPNLWKITYKPDLYAAEQMVKERLQQVALVTGGGRGIGKETVRGLRNRGLYVAAVSRTKEDLVEVEKETGCFTIVADVSKKEDVQRVFEEVITEFGRIDILVNNAGTAALGGIADMDEEEWDHIISGNLSSTFYSCRHALRHMRESGRGGTIVNVGSSSINGGREGQGAYAASKAGIQCLTETIALEGKEYGVNSYCVMPRRTFTQLRKSLYPDEDPADCLQPEEVAAVIISVATDSNPLLTGQSFWVR